jgi:hypothetical protein
VETSTVKNEEPARYWNGDESVHRLVHEAVLRIEENIVPAKPSKRHGRAGWRSIGYPDVDGAVSPPSPFTST